MSLDLTKIARQVEKMVAGLRASGQERQERRKHALGILTGKDTDLEQLKKKIDRSKTSWLVAELVDGLDTRYKPPPAPEDFTVIATDGSHIDADHHRQMRSYLINIGSVSLSYGVSPGAALYSSPRLYSDDTDLVIASPDANGREQPVAGTLLGIKRGVEECHHLAKMAAELPPGDVPVLGLLDGSLILWGLVNKDYPEFVTEVLLDNGFLRYLEQMKRLARQRRLAIASYISFSRSTDVVNALRVASCPHQAPDCDRYCDKIRLGERECDSVAGIHDRDLFLDLLNDGERSARFISQSSIVKKRYGDHRVYFFYLKVEDEVARIEIPEWVAMDKNRLGLVHTLVLDQCRRGHGYPVALSEAHEQAVITGADRENFQQLVEMMMAEEHLPVTASAKSRSKRTRWV